MYKGHKSRTPREGILEPSEDSLSRLHQWSRSSLARLSPIAGEEGARCLVDALVSECLGRRLDAIAPEGFINGLSPEYSEMRDFFQFFAPEIVVYLPAQQTKEESVERLRDILHAICSRLASDLPTTLGRFGRNLLSCEWKAIMADLARRMEASMRLAHSTGGEQAEAQCRAELEALLEAEFAMLNDPKAVLELRAITRKSFWRRWESATPTDH